MLRNHYQSSHYDCGLRYTFLSRTRSKDMRNSDITEIRFAVRGLLKLYMVATEAYEKHTEKRVLMDQN